MFFQKEVIVEKVVEKVVSKGPTHQDVSNLEAELQQENEKLTVHFQ